MLFNYVLLSLHDWDGAQTGFGFTESARSSAGSVASVCYALIIVLAIADAVDDLTNMLILPHVSKHNTINIIIRICAVSYCDP